MGSLFSNIDLSLLRKYDKPGPRYTSYPTAPLFKSTFTAEDFRDEIEATNAPGVSSDLSLYLHFPFCDTLCYFCGCTMLVTRDRKRIEEYNQLIKQEIDLIAPRVARGRRVVQLHWGGGTPSHLSPDQIRDVAGHTVSSFQVSPDAEVSVEIDPRELTKDHLIALRESGFNRMSMGVQDFNQRVQEGVNRIQPEAMTSEVYGWARELGFQSINLDLIYGLPFQTVRGFEETVRKIIQYSPDRIAVFNYAHVPWLKPHQKLIHEEDLPDPEEKLQILKMTIELLCSHGYEYIGMDHFSKPDDELAVAQKEKTLYRNFQGYSTKSGADLFGFGMSSISHFQDIYAQNVKTLPEYYAALRSGTFATHVGYRMTGDDHIRKYVIMRLMCDLELDTRAVGERFGISFETYFADSLRALREFVDDGLVEIPEGRIAIVGAGRLLLRNIAMCFDAYLESMRKEQPIFSRTV
ncbi:MAG: oxygen-independent coproporphyrinogen III oxidase [Bacteroidetes bacterium]|nr:oxygen-independent coproporphyrinogen III oxidase [Bacteroidota bacterium]